MTIQVLVVDDSAFFRKRICEILDADPRLTVVGTAADGIEAVEQARHLRPDVITMDIEMPRLNGIEAVRQIMAIRPVSVLMFSSLTYEGAKATLDALEAGATDFLPKQFESVSRHAASANQQLVTRVLALAHRPAGVRPISRSHLSVTPASKSVPVVRTVDEVRTVVSSPVTSRGPKKMLVIGASTGGPMALQTVLKELPANFPVPVVVAIHMPESFTTAYADRLNSLCQVRVREAKNNDRVVPGEVLIAPGGHQLVFDRQGGNLVVQVKEDNGQIYRPSVDVLFGSAARVLGNQVLAMVMTGMGADGAKGARLLKQGGSILWSQDEASCVVYGMPQAVEKAGLSDRVLPLNAMGAALRDFFH